MFHVLGFINGPVASGKTNLQKQDLICHIAYVEAAKSFHG